MIWRNISYLDNCFRIAMTSSHVCSNKIWNQWWISLTNIMFWGDTLLDVYHWIEKRGLPHAHILIWLIEKITSNETDEVISIETLDVDIDTCLLKFVTKNIIHGSCGSINNNSPSINDGKYIKRYLRDLTLKLSLKIMYIYNIVDNQLKMVAILQF